MAIKSMEAGEPAHERTPGPRAGEADAAKWPAPPPLSGLAVVAALAHLGIYRVLLPILASQRKPLPTLLLLGAPFALNLTACAALVGFTACAVSFVRSARLAPPGRRVLIGFLSAVIVSTLLLAIFVPRTELGPQQVLLAAGAVHTLAVQLAVCALRLQRSVSGRTTAGLVAAASGFPLGLLLFRQWGPGAGGIGLSWVHALGELAYLLVPIAAAFLVVPWGEDGPARRARTVGVVAAAGMAVLFALAARLPHKMYGHILYSALRLEWAMERALLGYAAPISLAIGAAVAASLGGKPASRIGGAGLFLWLAAGYNPLAPARLIVAALGASLICQAVIDAPWRGAAGTPSQRI